MKNLILFMIPSLALSMAQCRDAFQMIEEDARESGATVRLQNFQRQEVAPDGRQRWFIKAEEAFIYMNGNKQDKLVVYDFHFIEYDDAGQVRNDVKAKRAQVDYEKQLMHMRGEVESRAGNRVVQAEALVYNMETKILESNQPVVISDDGLFTRCAAGATIDTKRNRQVCRGSTVVKENKPNPNPVPGAEQNELDIFQ